MGKIILYRCMSLESAEALFERFKAMNLKNLDKEKFMELYDKGKENIGFCIRNENGKYAQ